MISQKISHYKILEKLGEGGMGVVYKAEDSKLKRFVALKFLSEKISHDSEEKIRFLREARAAAALDHPNIVAIHEIAEVDDQSFIAMAYVEGSTLKQKFKSGLFEIEEAIELAKQIAEGLREAHEKEIIHRDIKSTNIMVNQKGQVKITDFGLAKLRGDATITKSGSQMGTAAYMSPEQIQGETVDHRSDIFSFGVLLYEMFSGQLPFHGENEQAAMYSILYHEPVPLLNVRPDIPVRLAQIVEKSLEKEKENRYQSAQQFLADLTKFKKVFEREKHKNIVEQRIKPERKKETERRQVTIIFVEILGYNEILESMDTEEVAAIMSRCFKLFGSIAQKYGTKIDKTAGSSLSILFGIPGAIENAPKNAINVAIELRNTLYQFNKKENLQIPLDIHIGINTGMVIAGALDTDEKKDYSVMGDAVNLASQLKDLCVKGQIYVGPSTYINTKNEFEYKSLKPITLKGKKEPLRVYELISVKEKIYRARLSTERMIVSEMVGREKDLDRLHFHLLKLLNGEGSIVSVIGEAGIGKSRLIAEFRKKNEINRVALLEGRTLSIGRNLSFHPIIDIFKQWSGIKEDDNEAESFHKLENAIRNIYPEGAGEVFPFIATLMGLKLTGKYAERIKGIDGEALEKLILKNLHELLAKAADQKALVFVIEDLHWADLSSIKLLESLYRLAENNCILFINVFRPNYEETGDRILITIKDRYNNLHSEINLESLNEKQSEIVVNNLLKVEGLPPKIEALIIKRAEGNPFFIEEVVRSFIDEGVLVIKDGGFNVTEKIESVVIPETINEVLMARIDKLDESTRSLVKVASVIGRNFFYKILFEVAVEIEEIDERLVYLEEVQFILERRRMEEVEYLFKHALAQQAAYDSILVKKRKELHLKVAQAIVTVFKERLQEFFGTLALHYSLGEDLDRAENYLIKAGEESLKSSASSEALHYYQEALDIYRRKCGDTVNTEKIAMLEKNIAIALFNTGHNEETVEYFERVLAYYGVRAPKHPVAVILKFLIGLFDFMIKLEFQFLMGKKIPAQKEIDIFYLMLKKTAALAVTNPRRFFIEWTTFSKWFTKFDLTKMEYGYGAFGGCSTIFSFSGISFRLSRKMLEFSKDKINKSDVKSVLQYEFAKVTHNLLAGNWGADCYDDKLVNQALRFGEVFYIATYQALHSQISIERGSLDAKRIVDKLSEIADVYENDYAKVVKFRLRTLFLLKYRKLYNALLEADAGIDFIHKIGHRPIRFVLYSLKARIHMLLGDIKGAGDSLRNAKDLLSKDRFAPYFLCNFLTSQFIFDLCRLEEALKSNNKSELNKNSNRAFKSGKRAVKVSRKAAFDRVEIFNMMGVYYWLVGKQIKALKWWKRCILEGEHMGARLELSRAYMEIGKRLLEPESRHQVLDGVSAEAYLEKAEELFKEMNLLWDLNELENVNRENIK